jgi:hypothetical protein
MATMPVAVGRLTNRWRVQGANLGGAERGEPRKLPTARSAVAKRRRVTPRIAAAPMRHSPA